MNCNQLIKKLGFGNYPLDKYTISKETIEIEPENGWRRWKLGNKIQLNITLNRPE